MRTDALWSRRFRNYWMQNLPYLRYILGGGYVGYFIAVIVVLIIVYGRWVKNVQPGFPAQWIALLTLLPLTVWTPVRTFAQAADFVFLLPMDSRMKPYFRKALLSAFLLQGTVLLTGTLLYYPLYVKSEAGHAIGMPVIAGILLLLKLLNICSSWVERYIRHAASRRLLGLVRIGFSGAAVYMVIEYSLKQSLLFIAACALVHAALLYLPAKLQMPWERWIELEDKQRAAWNRFFNAFVDVPAVQKGRIRRRMWLTRPITDRLVAFGREGAFRRVWLNVYMRSELLGITLRIAIIGAAAIWIFDSAWLKALIYGIVIAILYAQLSGLGRIGGHLIWNRIYPLPAGLLTGSAAWVVQGVLFIFTVLLYIPVIITVTAADWPVLALPLAAGWFALRKVRGLARKWAEEDGRKA